MQFYGKKIAFSIGQERATLLTCIGISVVIWFFMKLSGEFSTTRHVHLSYQLPPTMSFREPPPKQLTATLEGTGLALLNMYLRHPHPTVHFDLNKNQERPLGQDEIKAKLEAILHVSVKSLDPDLLHLPLENMASKKVPVQPVLEVTYATDFFQKDSLQLFPDSVTISGPSKALEKVDAIFTEKITATGLDGDLRQVAKLLVPKAGKLHLVPEETEVYLPVEQFTERKFTVTINVPGPDSIRLLPSEVEVKCVVGMSRYHELAAKDILLEADFSGRTEAGPTNQVNIKLVAAPSWVRSVTLVPPAVEFYIVQ